MNNPQIVPCATIGEWVKKIIIHPAQKSALDQILEAMEVEGTDDNLIALTGPTGAGKSTIGEVIVRRILQQELEEMKKDPAYIPAVHIKVFKTPAKQSIWKATTKRILVALGDPLPDKKRVFDPKKENTAMSQEPADKSTDSAIQAIINQFRERRTKLLVLDESQHLLFAGNGRTEEENLETIKSLCNETQTKCLLIGPYSLPSLIRGADQTTRRCHEIHLAAYGNAEGKKFINAARNLMAYLPIPVAKDVPDDLLTIGSLRLIGLLKNWLHRASVRARRRGHEVVSWELLKEARYTAQQLDVFAKAMSAGEALFAENSALEDELRRYLSLAVDEKETPTPKPRKYKPGKRSLGHDPIGQ